MKKVKICFLLMHWTCVTGGRWKSY